MERGDGTRRRQRNRGREKRNGRQKLGKREVKLRKGVRGRRVRMNMLLQNFEKIRLTKINEDGSKETKNDRQEDTQAHGPT